MPKERSINLEVARRKAAEKQLVESYAELQQAHEELKASQKSLVQNEKMASLGILSAGVAHEINNPVGYILSNITTLADYLPKINAGVTEMRSLIESIPPESSLYERRTAVEETISQLDLNYLLEDTRELVEETREGANRVLAIVRGLRNFVHSDDDSMVPSNVNECLQSTLNLVNNELKYHCRVDIKLGSLPPVVCSIGKLGQVFMNMLINAGHAIVDKGIISITTSSIGEMVEITIEDNGSGMSETTLKNIFQPFYTTKPKGRGTGLGLAISYGIVEEHGGSIDVSSEEGIGTRFVIRLPIGGPDGSLQNPASNVQS